MPKPPTRLHWCFSHMLTIALTLLLAITLQAQVNLPDGVLISPRGTGRTTGHIATLNIRNTTDQPHRLDLGPLYIPATGKYQPYILPETPGIAIPANGAVSVPLEGYCADIHKEPVPHGFPMILMDEWIQPAPLPQSWTPQKAHGWDVSTNSPLFIPGTNRDLGHIIDIHAHPDEAAPVLMQAIRHIISATDDQLELGLITTPFTGNPEKEREAIIQQTFWIYSSALNGEPYTQDQFADQTHQQFETNTGRPVESLNEQQQTDLDTGIETFWNSFQATGVEAKVLRQEPGIVYQERPVSVTPQCTCDSLSIAIRILDGDREVGSETMTVTRFTQKSQDLNITDPEIEDGSDLRIEISGISMHCSCNAGGLCIAYPPKRTGGPDTTKADIVQIRTGENEAQVTNDNFQCFLTNDADNRWNENGTIYTMDLHFAKYGKHDSDPYQCIQFTAWCAQDGCKRKRCNQSICLRFSWEKK